MEVFALAWRDKFEHDKYTIPQSIFTRRYLEENGRLDIWDIMGEYNRGIAQSAHMTESGKETDEQSLRHINKLRADMYDKWTEVIKGRREGVAVARVGNRIGADIRRADYIAAKLLAARLADRLGANMNLRTEALFKLEATIVGFYEGASEYLRSVTLQWQVHYEQHLTVNQRQESGAL